MINVCLIGKILYPWTVFTFCPVIQVFFKHGFTVLLGPIGWFLGGSSTANTRIVYKAVCKT